MSDNVDRYHELQAARAQLALARGGLEAITGDECAYAGSYENRFEATEDSDYAGPCPACIARRTLAQLDAPATPGEPR